MNRRAFLKRVAIGAGGTVGLGTAGYAYGRFEATWLEVAETTIAVPRLPPPFAGLRVALLTDPHHGRFNSLEYIASVVTTVVGLSPDLIALGGDFAHGPHGRKYLAPCLWELARLKAPLGAFAVPGNHDYYAGITQTRRSVAAAGITDLTNRGVWLERGGHRLRLGGVDDLICGNPRPDLAIGEAGPDDACLILSHNPEVAETLIDPRVGLILAGHMHGGQVVIPGIGYHYLPARYGDKYVAGLVQGPVVAAFVSRGVGVIGL
ncbi:MAG TPA: metallophosphoesterase, partial [Gemmataceae bacterium]|nr:metallophosphoesterase [Gemmataceae bacterium]